MEELEMIFDRQYNIFNPKEQKTNLIVVGCGSIGSFVILNLAKLGFKNITAIDFDEVSIENIPNQFYRFEDIGKKKVEQIKKIVKDFSGTEIKTIDRKIDDENKFLDMVSIDLNTIIIFCLDNVQTRKRIYNEVKEMPIKICDVRVGGEGYNIYVLDMDNETDKANYEKVLEMPTSEEPCGSKSVIYNILAVASETCNLIKRIDKGESHMKIVKRIMTSYRFLAS